jgi:hypothetical protein
MPRPKGTRRRVNKAHDSSCSLTLLDGDAFLSLGNQVVWKLALRRDAVAKSVRLEDVLPSFHRWGSRFSEPMAEPSAVYAELSDAPPDGPARVVENGRAEFGLQTEDDREYFLAGDSLAGVLRVKRRDGGGWSASFAKSNLPRVLSKEAVDAALMPPRGVSALPAGLEAVVPEEFTYWKADGEQALAMRNALVESGFFGDDCIKVVDGELRKVEARWFLYEPKVCKSASVPTLGDRVSSVVPYGRDALIDNPFSADGDWLDTLDASDRQGGCVLLSPSSADVTPRELVRAVAPLKADWLIEYDDTEAAREAFHAAGPVFKFVGEPSRLFCASFPVRPVKGVEIVHKPFAGFSDFGDCVATIMRTGKSEDAARRICGSLQSQEKADTEKAARYDHIDFKPPQSARTEAERGLAWRREFGRGGTGVGIARARDIANGVSLSPDTIVRMSSYFARHEVDQKGEGWSPGEKGYPSNGRIAWALWGGDAGRGFADKVKRQMEAADREQTSKSLRVLKADDAEQRYVLGIVLEPDVVDAQQDTYSAGEVRQAAERFMEQFRNVGLMHKEFVNEQVKILESYVAPTDFRMGDGQNELLVRKGTWLMAVRVLDDALWSQVKDGGLTGFSIGGSAVRTPEPVGALD